jgi:hypothetical protein
MVTLRLYSPIIEITPTAMRRIELIRGTIEVALWLSYRPTCCIGIFCCASLFDLARFLARSQRQSMVLSSRVRAASREVPGGIT